MIIALTYYQIIIIIFLIIITKIYIAHMQYGKVNH